MLHNGTDWNRNHGVGATLLENWVEERAVGDRIVEERSSISKLSKQGHKDILTHGKLDSKSGLTTTAREAYESAINQRDRQKIQMGKRHQLMEAELMRRALSEVKEPPVDRSAREWVSTAHSDYASKVPIKTLGTAPPPEDQARHFAHPITFWSDHATKGIGTVICSSKAEQLPNGKKTVDTFGGQGVRFGRHAAFSTPVAEYNKKPVKDE